MRAKQGAACRTALTIDGPSSRCAGTGGCSTACRTRTRKTTARRSPRTCSETPKVKVSCTQHTAHSTQHTAHSTQHTSRVTCAMPRAKPVARRPRVACLKHFLQAPTRHTRAPHKAPHSKPSMQAKTGMTKAHTCTLWNCFDLSSRSCRRVCSGFGFRKWAGYLKLGLQ